MSQLFKSNQHFHFKSYPHYMCIPSHPVRRQYGITPTKLFALTSLTFHINNEVKMLITGENLSLLIINKK